MTKLDEFIMGCRIIKEFCRLNKIKQPKMEISEEIEHVGYYSFSTPDTIYVNPKMCNKSSKKNNPMMVYENTVVGTMLHEFGHYLHFTYYPKLAKTWDKIKNEPLVHYYQRQIDEDIAECIRLAILNPSRLAKGRKKRFAILSKMFVLDVAYTPLSIVESYDKKHEKLDIGKWELFLV